MIRRISITLLLLAPWAARAEIIDRIAVSVGNMVITTSEALLQIRVAALIDGQPLRLDAAARRSAAERLIELALIRREMQLTRYPVPEAAAVDALFREFKQKRFGPGEDKYKAALDEYGIREPELRRALEQQLSTLRFIDFRFRPGIQISTDDIQDYYQNQFLPKWRAASRDPAPELSEARAGIESVLLEERVNQALDRWISQTRTQTRILFREEAFR